MILDFGRFYDNEGCSSTFFQMLFGSIISINKASDSTKIANCYWFWIKQWDEGTARKWKTPTNDIVIGHDRYSWDTISFFYLYRNIH